MENKESQILSEIMAMMTSIRSQMDLLEAKVAELQGLADQEDMDMTPIDLDLDDIVAGPVATADEPIEVVQDPETEDEPVEPEVVDEPEIEVVVEPEVVEEPVAAVEPEDDDLPFEEIPEPSEEPVESGLEEAVEPEQEDDDLPVFMEPEPVQEPMIEPVVEPVAEPESVAETKPAVAVIDSMTDRQAWRTDMPGSPVRDIRSAISLNDRILFINGLFAQDPMAFQETLTRINQMETLDEVVAYLVAARPDWDLESEIVYRFMMAVRRKVK